MQRLMKIQQTLKAPKNQYNSFGGYNYRNCEDILEAVKPLLAENELTLVLNDDVCCIGERYYIKATAALYDLDGKLIKETSAYAREALNKKGMNESQITGACSSYARKYALNGLFCIDDTKDADAENNNNTSKTKQPHNKGNNDVEIIKKVKNFDDIEALKEYYELNKGKVTTQKAFHARVEYRLKELKEKAGERENATN